MPLLVRDIARELGITVPQACIALKPLGNYSTNAAVTAEMARMLRDHFPAPAHPAEGVPAQAFKTKVYQALGIGSACDEHVAFVNIENLIRREHCLSAIEREFFMVETPPDEDVGDTEPGKECLLYWGSTPEQYVKQFAEALAATHPTQQGLDALTDAARSVIAERTRQISAEGYTPEKDDGYNPGVLALHGGLYACHAYDNLAKKRAPEGWQWDEKWWKPKDPRSNLVKAGALILAEIERMDRSFAAQAKQGGAA